MTASKPDDDQIIVYVCATCKPEGDASEPPLGSQVYDRIKAAVAASGQDAEIRVEPVDCLSVCKRPTTVAVKGDDRWTYVYGDVTLDSDIDELVSGVKAYRRASNGIAPWRERPQMFRRALWKHPTIPRRKSQACCRATTGIRQPSNF